MGARGDGPATGDVASRAEYGTEPEKQCGRNRSRSVRQGNEVRVPVDVTPRRSQRRCPARSFGEMAG